MYIQAFTRLFKNMRSFSFYQLYHVCESVFVIFTLILFTGRISLTKKTGCFTPPGKGKVKLCFGMELDFLVATEEPNSKVLRYYEKTEEGTRCVWGRSLEEGLFWKSVNFISHDHIFVQSEINEVCLYNRDGFTLIKKVPCPGWLCGLTDNGYVVVGNDATGSEELKLMMMTPASDFEQCHHGLNMTYNKGAELRACGCQEGRVAVVESQKNSVHFFDPAGDTSMRCFSTL